jgi:hypothetical protein
MAIKYYYIGLEARLRGNNKYQDLDKARIVAAYSAKVLRVPVRIFAMLENNHSEVAEVVEVEAALGMSDEVLKDLMADIFFS